MPIELIPADLRDLYQLYEFRHACAILSQDYPNEWEDLLGLLREFRLKKSWLMNPGGNKSKISIFVDKYLGGKGWVEKKFKTQIKVDEVIKDSPTHKIDCYKNSIALEVEWNNKDPFFDRDLNNFRLLFDLRVVSVGIIFTRADALQEIFNEIDRGKSYGESTTHMSKLLPKIIGGGGAGCPILVVGITNQVLENDTVQNDLP